MKVNFFKEKTSVRISAQKRKKDWIKFTIEREGFHCGDLNYIFCSDQYLLNINREYLQHDYFTDVITFNYVEEKVISGDIFISIDTVKRNAKEYNVAFDNELCRVIIHGVLHLVGYDDKDDLSQQEMTKKENEYLQELLKF